MRRADLFTHSRHTPADWTVILPGFRSPSPQLRVEDAARTFAEAANGAEVVLHTVTCGYPGYDTFQGLSAETLAGLYLGVVAAPWAAAPSLAQAIVAAQHKAAA